MGVHKPLKSAVSSTGDQTLAKIFHNDFNPQLLCPLFSQVPNEIRNIIFELALTEYDDKVKPYSRRFTSYRPGYSSHKVISTSLLLTCRRIYLEARLVPLAVNEHTFWCFQAPTGWKKSPRTLTYFDRLTYEQRKAVGTVHLITSNYQLGSSWHRDLTEIAGTWLNKLVFTLRHEHWAFFLHGPDYGFDPTLPVGVIWDDNGRPYAPNPNCPDGPYEEVFGFPMAREEIWGRQFQEMHGLRELQIEFETLESRKQSLERVVTFAKSWRFDLKDGRVLTAEGTQVVQRKWTSLNERRWKEMPPRLSSAMCADKWLCRIESETNFFSMALTWRARSATAADEERRAIKTQHIDIYDPGLRF